MIRCRGMMNRVSPEMWWQALHWRCLFL